MDDIEKQKLEELFARTTNTVEGAVAIAKEKLDACFACYGDDTDFVLICKTPNSKETYDISMCAGDTLSEKGARGVGTIMLKSTAHLLKAMEPEYACISIVSKLRNLFKWGSK